MEYTIPIALLIVCVVVAVGMYWGGFGEEKRNAR